MIVLKILVLIVMVIISFACFFNFKKWASKLQRYFISQANSVFGFSFGWDKSWALLLCRIIIIFIGIILFPRGQYPALRERQLHVKRGRLAV